MRDSYPFDRRTTADDERFNRRPWPNLAMASELVPISRDWLWPRRIPAGCLTLLVGDPGVGKSLLVADLAARISNSLPWPDSSDDAISPGGASECSHGRQPVVAGQQDPQSPGGAKEGLCTAAALPSAPLSPFTFHLPRRLLPHTGGVLIISNEDSRTASILPRLIAAGANLDRVALLNGLYYPQIRNVQPTLAQLKPRDPAAAPEAHFHLPDHLETLQQAIRSVTFPRLVVLDPLHSLLTPGVQSSPDHLNQLLMGLAETARDYGVAILAVIHLTKESAARTLYRVRGSLSFIAAARAAFLLSADPIHANRRILSTLKSVYAQPAPPIAFEIASRLLDPPGFFDRPVEIRAPASGAMPSQAAPSISPISRPDSPAAWVGMHSPEDFPTAKNTRPPTPQEIAFRRKFENPFADPIPAINWLDPQDAANLDESIDPADLAPLPEELLDYDPITRSATIEALEWLRHYLSAGARPVPEIFRDARAHRHSEKTLRRAKRRLGVRSVKPALDEPWSWSLPRSKGPDNKDGQPHPPAKSNVATFSQNAENAVSLESLTSVPEHGAPRSVTDCLHGLPGE